MKVLLVEKIMKKVLSCILTLCMLVCVVPIQTFAAKEDNFYEIAEMAQNKVEKNRIKQQMNDDLNNFYSIGYTKDMLTPSGVDSDGDIEYSVDFDGVTDQVKIDEDVFGNLTLSFTENGKTDILEITNSGEIIVNGDTFEFSVENSNSNISGSEAKIEAVNEVSANARNTSYSTTPQKSKTSYTKYMSTYKGDTISWGESTIAGLAIGVVATILSFGVSKYLDLPIAVSCISSVASSMLSYVNIHGMDDAYYSFKLYKYKSTQSTTLDDFFKYTGACYSKHNYKGTAYSVTYYVENYFT